MNGLLPNSGFFIAQRLRLHYVDWGNEAAPSLILLHGGQDHCRNWDWVAARLRQRFHVLAPDLRGHGDSAWSADGNYTTPAYTYDLAQLIHSLNLAPVRIVGHSLGGHIAIRHAATYPETVVRLVVIEGLGLASSLMREREAKSLSERTRAWIERTRQEAGRQKRRYPSLEAALARMSAANKHLTPEQARHLTEHGVMRNEDGTLSWKFDDYVRVGANPHEATLAELQDLWSRIACPVLLAYGAESWASNPLADGRAAHFRDARVRLFEGAGHWVHHDHLDEFMSELDAFL